MIPNKFDLKKKRITRFWFCVRPSRGLFETWVVGLIILTLLTLQKKSLQPLVFNSGLLFLCGVCGVWAVMRIRLAQGKWVTQVIFEMVVAVVLDLVMFAGLMLLPIWLGYGDFWQLISWDRVTTDGIRAGTGLGYIFCRVIVRLFIRWNELRRKRMLWALTHAHLSVAAFGTIIGVAALFYITPYTTFAIQNIRNTTDPLAILITGILLGVFPLVSLGFAAVILALIVILPPSALISFFFARRMTRRVEDLVQVAGGISAGDYRARIPVQGEDEIARLQSDFNVMAEKLEIGVVNLQIQRDKVSQTLQERRDLIANVSHEIRTPIATIRALVETTLNSGSKISSAEMQSRLESMAAEIKRLGSLVDDLFTLSLAETGGMQLRVAPVNIVKLIGEIVKLFSPLAWNSSRVQMIAETSENLPCVCADEFRLKQVINNLLRNALQHTPPGGIIVVAASMDEKWVRVDVEDTGEGIEPDELEHVWDRFYRGSRELNAQSDHAGLGLAIVKELVERMGGKVFARSQSGKGSCFTFRLLIWT